MFTLFGALALLVAAVGTYGVIAYNVAQRMHEIGVRVALGAQPGNVIRLIVRQGARFAIAGILAGLGIAILASGWLEPLLFQQSATDPLTYGAVSAILLAVAIAASAIPAIRASRLDPSTVLRAE